MLYFKLIFINQQNWTVIAQGKVDRAFRRPGWRGYWEKRTDKTGGFKHRYISPSEDVYRFVDFYLS